MVKFFNRLMLYIRCKRAIRQANQQAVITGRKQLVLMYDGKPIVLSKQYLKKLIREGSFIKGFNPGRAEELAIYKTR